MTEKKDLLPSLAAIFQKYGFEGASLAKITQATGLGKGSLYHFFPGGKLDMAREVLGNIDAWFDERIFKPLLESPNGAEAIAAMFDAIEEYFRSGQEVCIHGVFALTETRALFHQEIERYFSRWVASLTCALKRAAHPEAEACAEEIVGGIQGALVLSRALDDPAVFSRTLKRLRSQVPTQAAENSPLS